MESSTRKLPTHAPRTRRYYTATTGEICEDDVHSARMPRFTVANSVVNNTGYDLYIRGRDNVTHCIRGNVVNTELRKGIYYTAGYFSDDKVEFDVRREVHNNLNRGGSAIVQNVPKSRPHGTGIRPGELTKHYYIAYEDIAARGGCLYLREIDVMVSLNELRHMPDHIANSEGYLDVLEEMVKQMEDNSAGIMIGVIDNANVWGTHYMNLNGDVQRITPVTNSMRADGVYILRKGLNDHPNEVKVDFYALDKLNESAYCPVKFFRTPAEAISFGDVSTQAARLWEKEKAEYEREIFRLKAESEREGLLRKDFYEEKSLNRKDDSENLKMFVASVGVVGGIFTLVSKLGSVLRPASLLGLL